MISIVQVILLTFEILVAVLVNASHQSLDRDSASSSYSEEVLIRQFPDGKLLVVSSHTRWLDHNDVWHNVNS